MGDIFIEQLVKKQTNAGQKSIVFILSFLAAVLCFAGFFFNFFILFIPGILLAVGAFLCYRNSDIEYEYCLVNTQLDFDKIIAKSSRKHLMTVDLKNLEIAAPINSSRLSRINDIKTVDYSSKDSSVQTFAMVVRTENQAVKIIFNPSNKLMDAIYKLAPRKVFAD